MTAEKVRPRMVARALAPAIASGWLLAFTLSLDDLVITTFAAGPSTNTLPMMIFSKARLGVTPEINALATLMITSVAVVVVIAGVLMTRQEKARQRDMHLAQATGGLLQPEVAPSARGGLQRRVSVLSEGS